MPRVSLFSRAVSELVRPRRLRFSVRTLVILITLLGFFFGLYVVPAHRAGRAADVLQQAGCEIRWSYQMRGGKFDANATSGVRPELLSLFGPAYFHRVVELRCPPLDALHTKPAAQALARYLPALGQLETLELAPGIANDDVLAAIGRLRHVQSLSIAGEAISDRGLAHIGRLTRLQTLSIHAPHITDQGVSHFKSLTSLRSLHLRTTSSPVVRLPNQPAGLSYLTLDRDPVAPPSTPAGGQASAPASGPAGGVTNEAMRTLGQLGSLVTLSVLSDGVSVGGLAHLGGLTRLEHLQLSDRTDAPGGALVHLQPLASLKSLSLFQTMFTREDIESLSRTNPQLTWILSRNLYVAAGRVSEMPLNIPSRPQPAPANRSPAPLPPPRDSAK
jgi:hypothetical protein